MSLGGSLGILVGLVFLMTTKPELDMSIAAVATAVVAGMAVMLAIRRQACSPSPLTAGAVHPARITWCLSRIQSSSHEEGLDKWPQSRFDTS